MTIRLLFVVLLLVSTPVAAHHGSAISYDTTNLWTTWATVTEFAYQNPHPTMKFDRTTKDGKVEHWVSELLTNPSVLVRAGWTRTRSNEALKPGTRVKLYLGTSRAGGHSGIVMKIENEKGETIVGDRAGVKAVADLDGVPDGLQPKGEKKLPGQPTAGRS
jgi:Family of unknown function (DUF6152)